eukprot:TRINITY_DN2370_c0_g1_i2.p1 TRINITY_DN2370_c0_g1~~TRINITY_DN2370_c0_g1_i2.p1  ORF type:complete len:161 (+),score=20.75 TRINITY_DN2370_c0_g1_i2:407-889(+)
MWFAWSKLLLKSAAVVIMWWEVVVLVVIDYVVYWSGLVVGLYGLFSVLPGWLCGEVLDEVQYLFVLFDRSLYLGIVYYFQYLLSGVVPGTVVTFLAFVTMVYALFYTGRRLLKGSTGGYFAFLVVLSSYILSHSTAGSFRRIKSHVRLYSNFISLYDLTQ